MAASRGRSGPSADRGRGAGEGPARSARERALVLGVETVLKGLLFVLLGVAAVKFHGMLSRLGVAWWKGLPVSVAFGAAAVWAGRGLVRGAADLWRGRSV